ncbi:MAG: transketolase [Acidobacteriota bacterium]
MNDASTLIERLAINTIRTLSIDAIQAANSGHPGAPMGMAPVAYALWQRFLRFDPDQPIWPNRDRFVLSAGHASMLLYSMLHVSSVKAVDDQMRVTDELAVPLDQIKTFRQLHSRCPGHPEYRLTTGVETTTGPLGQGAATSVGMAMASRWLGEYFNRPGYKMFDFDVFALAGDGCMMEGLSSEAASLAGHLKLDNLCWIYDSNHITIEGATSLAFSEDVGARFEAYGWNVRRVADANDLADVDGALAAFRATADRPTLIIVSSVIGDGAPHKQGTKEAHGEPLGPEEVRLAKRAYGWPEDAQFLVPDGVREHFASGIGARGRDLSAQWRLRLERYASEYPELADHLQRVLRRELPEHWDADLQAFPADAKGLAGREASSKALNAIGARVPWLMGGSADLTPSTKTRLSMAGAGDFAAGAYGGRNVHFGIREHAMGAVLNGLSLCGVRPYGSGFFIFSDYGRPSLRMAALMALPVIYVFTHDSIGVGEDGPTHQPVEQLTSLRAMPGVITLRPADANEVIEAWRLIMPLTREPVALLLTRQALPTFDRTKCAPASGVARGAYVLIDAADGQPDLLLLSSGSEVALCLDAREQLLAAGIKARVVSMPSWEIFERQDRAYRDSVIPPSVEARVAVEAATTLGWDRYVGPRGAVIGMKTFGASAPIKVVMKHFGFTPEHIVEVARTVVGGQRA